MSTTTKKNRDAVKGTVAAAAGVAVLLGGMGTFALWSDNADLSKDVALATGQLSIEAEPLAWEDITAGGSQGLGADELNAFRLVPGDVLQGTTEITLSTTGENIAATPAITIGGAETVVGTGVPVATSLPEGVTAVLTVPDFPTGSLLGTGSETYTATVTIEFAAGTEDSTGAGTMLQAVDLSDIAISFVQQSPQNNSAGTTWPTP